MNATKKNAIIGSFFCSVIKFIALECMNNLQNFEKSKT